MCALVFSRGLVIAPVVRPVKGWVSGLDGCFFLFFLARMGNWSRSMLSRLVESFKISAGERESAPGARYGSFEHVEPGGMCVRYRSLSPSRALTARRSLLSLRRHASVVNAAREMKPRRSFALRARRVPDLCTLNPIRSRPFPICPIRFRLSPRLEPVASPVRSPLFLRSPVRKSEIRRPAHLHVRPAGKTTQRRAIKTGIESDSKKNRKEKRTRKNEEIPNEIRERRAPERHIYAADG